MTNNPIATATDRNQDTYDRLYVSLLDNLGALQILIAICGNDRQRYAIIDRYENELSSVAQCLRASLNPKEPSLKRAIETAVAQATPRLDHIFIASVTGAEQLDSTSLPQFFGYLQWTREGLRSLTMPIVLWLPDHLLPRIAKQSPDFWSWRNGVFIFEPEPETSPDQSSPLDTATPAIGSRSLPPETRDTPLLFSIAQLEDSLARAITQWGAESQNLAPLYAQVGAAYKDRFQAGECVDREQEVARSEALLKKAIDLQTEQPQPLATSLNNLAELYRSMGRYEEALPLYQRSLSIREEQLGANHPDTATSLNNLAELYYYMGRYEEALPLFQRSLSIREEQLGANHPDTATSLNNLAALCYSMGRYEEALPLYQRSLSIREEQLGANHPDTANSLNNLAELYYYMGRYEEALPLYQRSLSICEEQLGANHPDTATTLNNLAGLYDSMGRYEEALPLYQRSLSIREEQLGANHPDTATSFNNLAGLYRSMGRYEEALPLYQRSLSIWEEQLGANHPNTADSLFNLAVLYHQTQRRTDALTTLQRAIKIYKQKLGNDHPTTKAALSWLEVIEDAKLD